MRAEVEDGEMDMDVDADGESTQDELASASLHPRSRPHPHPHSEFLLKRTRSSSSDTNDSRVQQLPKRQQQDEFPISVKHEPVKHESIKQESVKQEQQLQQQQQQQEQDEREEGEADEDPSPPSQSQLQSHSLSQLPQRQNQLHRQADQLREHPHNSNHNNRGDLQHSEHHRDHPQRDLPPREYQRERERDREREQYQLRGDQPRDQFREPTSSRDKSSWEQAREHSRVGEQSRDQRDQQPSQQQQQQPQLHRQVHNLKSYRAAQQQQQSASLSSTSHSRFSNESPAIIWPDTTTTSVLQQSSSSSSTTNRLALSTHNINSQAAPPPPPPLLSSTSSSSSSTLSSSSSWSPPPPKIYHGISNIDDYENLKKVGEGTFGEVNIMKNTKSGKIYALKKILMHNEKEGVPITALREIKILKSLSHENIIELTEIAVRKGNKQTRQRGEVHMVFPFMDHDLNGLLENPTVRFYPHQIKSYFKQLLCGTDYLHRNLILHRDMKTANILIDNTGCLKIADFGLARAHLQSVKDPRYTNMVVTRWYRPPELLLGGTRYGPAIDVWGVGCVFGEILRRRPILIGNDDFDQLKKVIELCGTPTAESWPGLRDLPNMSMIANLPNHERSMKAMFKHFIDDRYFIGVFDLLEKIFVLDPTKRLTAAEALLHPYFFAKPDPAVVGSDDFNCKWEQSHELSSRQRRSAAAATQQQVSDLIPGMKLESQQAPLAVPPPHYTLPSDMDHYYKVMGAGSLAGQPLHNGGGVVGAGANGSGGAGGQNGDSRQRGGVQPQYEHRGQGGGRGGGGSRYTGGERYSRDGRDGRENRGGDYSGSRRDDGGGRRGGGGDDRDSRRDDKRDERRDDRRDGRDRDTAGGRDRFDGGRQTHNEGGGGGGHQRSTSHSHGLPPRPNQNQ